MGLYVLHLAEHILTTGLLKYPTPLIYNLWNSALGIGTY